MSAVANKKQRIIPYCNASLTVTPSAVSFVPSSASIVMVAQKPNGKGLIQMYELSDGSLQVKNSGESLSGLRCLTFGSSFIEARNCATGSFDGNLAVYDLENFNVPIYNVKGHKEIINCIDGIGGLNIGYGAPEIATGSRDGSVCVWDIRVRSPVAVLASADQTLTDCWAVSFGGSYDNDNRSLAVGYENGDVKLFDLKTNKIVWEDNVGNGICGLAFDRKDIEMNKLIISTLEAKIRVYDMKTNNSKLGYAHCDQIAHGSTVWFVQPLPQNREVFMSGGGNGTICLWKYCYPTARSVKDDNGEMKGVAGTLELINENELSTQPAISLSWSPDRIGLFASCTLDQTLRVGFVTKLNTL